MPAAARRIFIIHNGLGRKHPFDWRSVPSRSNTFSERIRAFIERSVTLSF
jgi:hypothetical protein